MAKISSALLPAMASALAAISLGAVLLTAAGVSSGGSCDPSPCTYNLYYGGTKTGFCGPTDNHKEGCFCELTKGSDNGQVSPQCSQY